MSRISLYEAFIWLGTVEKTGLAEFTSKQLKDINVHNFNFFQCLLKKKFIITTGKEVRERCKGKGTYTANIWKINEKVVKKHKFGNLVYHNIKEN